MVSRIRKTVFWLHLVIGVLGGIVILMMSVTGVLLAYERQIQELDERRFDVEPQPETEVISIDDLRAIGKRMTPDVEHFEFKIVNKPGAVFTIVSNDWDVWLIDPYNGDVLREGDGAIANFFYFMTEVHRWFAADLESRPVWRAVTGYGNLIFLVLILTGAYLWLPRAWSWSMLRIRLFFNPRAANAKARDYNWHHVFSVWALIPLFLISLSGIVISFPWANDLVYAIYGESDHEHEHEHHQHADELTTEFLSHQEMLDIAIRHAEENDAVDWHAIWMDASEGPDDPASFYIDRSIGHRLEYGYDLTIDSRDGKIIEYMKITDYSKGDQIRWHLRFLHTGDAYGFVGQTIAMLATIATCLLVYTGMALAWRRLVSPLLRGRN